MEASLAAKFSSKYNRSWERFPVKELSRSCAWVDWQANLPLLQRELLHCSHLARQSPHQYLMHQDHSVIDVTKPTSQLPPQQPGSRRSPREDRAITAATPETSSLAGVAAIGSGKRKSPDDR